MSGSTNFLRRRRRLRYVNLDFFLVYDDGSSSNIGAKCKVGLGVFAYVEFYELLSNLNIVTGSNF